MSGPGLAGEAGFLEAQGQASIAEPAAESDRFKATQVEDPYRALGLISSYLMTKKAFARQRFGDWTRVLAGQINRRHYLVVRDGQTVVAFAGWALAPRDKAEAWLAGRGDLGDGKAGEIFVFNAWEASSFEAHRFLLDEMRRHFQSAEMIYYKRFYDDGRIRPVRLTVNEFVTAHIARNRASATGG